MVNLTIIVPCYNEEEILDDTAGKLLEVITGLTAQEKILSESSIIFVDDGSKDNTWCIIEKLSAKFIQIQGIKLSKNSGHQNALLAGIMSANGDAVVSVDADLQDDIDMIEGMVDEFQKGYEIVYGVRKNRSSDTRAKRISAELYYVLLKTMGVAVVFNHADFRLMGRQVIEALGQFQETNLFLRGIIPSIGFSSSIVSYDRKKRTSGKSKYTLFKMLSLAIDGIVSFTSFPLRIIFFVGLIIFLCTLVLSCWVLWVVLKSGDAVPGWASSVLPMYLLGGIQLLSIGVLGEYIGKTFMETKKRPRYIIEKRI